MAEEQQENDNVDSQSPAEDSTEHKLESLKTYLNQKYADKLSNCLMEHVPQALTVNLTNIIMVYCGAAYTYDDQDPFQLINLILNLLANDTNHKNQLISCYILQYAQIHVQNESYVQLNLRSMFDTFSARLHLSMGKDLRLIALFNAGYETHLAEHEDITVGSNMAMRVREKAMTKSDLGTNFMNELVNGFDSFGSFKLGYETAAEQQPIWYKIRHMATCSGRGRARRHRVATVSNLN